MRPRPLALAATALAAAALAGPAAAQARAAHPQPYHAPRTAFGQPDLQGSWTNAWLTQLQRRPGLPLTFASPAEEAAYEQAATARSKAAPGDALGQGASEWLPVYPLARIGGRVRTSWIVSPADGRLPYRPEAARRVAALGAAFAAAVGDGPEDRTPEDRCLVAGGGSSGPPIVNANSATAKQIVQTSTEVAILSEMNHDVRIVRLGTPGHPPAHLPPSVRVWMGDSIGHWEGETLVVETTNFHPQEGNRLAFLMSPDAKVTERFTRVSPTELRYAFEVDDPATFTQVWRGEMPFRPETSPLYEYACHEGNYGLPNILAAARLADRKPATAAREEPKRPGE